jgi:hypothetical protein
MNYIPFLSTLIVIAFTIAVYMRYRRRKRTYLLLWTFGLLLYGVGTLSEVIMSFTYSDLMLKIWYLAGAMFTAAWLGQGTIHLLVRRRNVAPVLTGVLTVLSLVALGLIIFTPITEAAASYDVAQSISSQYKEILDRSGVTRILTVILNTYGTVALVGGAIYSAYIFWRKRVLINRMYGNILIATGALMPVFGGSILIAGLGDLLYVSELFGAIIMYAGFILATQGEVDESEKAPDTASVAS